MNMELAKNVSFRQFTKWLSSKIDILIISIDENKLPLNVYVKEINRCKMKVNIKNGMLMIENELKPVAIFEKGNESYIHLKKLKTSKESLEEFQKLINLKSEGATLKEIQEALGYSSRTLGWAKLKHLLKYRDQYEVYLDFKNL